MVILFIGDLCNLIGEGQRLTKILELVGFFQAKFSAFFIGLPARQACF